MIHPLNPMRTFVCFLALTLCQCGQNDSNNDNAEIETDIPVDSDPGMDTDSTKNIDTETATPAEPTWISLDFSLQEETAAAGNPVAYTAILLGDDGSTRSVEVSILSDKEPGLTFDTETLTATLAEIHTLTATWTENDQLFTDDATLTVVPGEPSTIEMKLLPTEPEVDTPLFVLAVIKDAFGNLCEDPWSLSASAEPGSDAASVLIDGENVVFTEDGWFSLIGTVDTNGLSGTLGPFLVDSYGPQLTVDHPGRGHWSTESEETATGNVGDDFSSMGQVVVNGEAADIDEDGNFSSDLTYEFGLNAVQTIATDADGNVSTDRRSVLSGSFKPRGQGIGNGIQARINQDTIDIIEETGENLVKSTNLNDLIPDPIYQNKAETCTFLGCILWYELKLYLDSVSIQDISLTLDPKADGNIGVTATVYQIRADWSSRVMVAGVKAHPHGTITADTITIKMDILPSVKNGQVTTALSNVNVSSTGFKFDFDSWIYDAAKFFGLNADGLVRGYVEGAIEDTVKNEVPKVLKDALHDLTLKLDFDLFGSTYNIQAKPYDIAVDDTGLTLGLETLMAPKKWEIPYTGKGSLHAGYTPPSYGGTPGIVLGFSEDFLNQALYAFWGGGLLHQTIELGPFEMPLDLPYLPKKIDNFHITTEALLPPVVIPGTGDHLLDLQAGDIKINLYSDVPSDPNNLFAVIYVGFTAELDLTISDQNTLAPRIDDVTVWFDLVSPIAPNGWEINLETLAETLVDEIIPFIHDAIGSIPVPTLYDLTIDSLQVEKTGKEKGYVTAGGQLKVL